MPVLFCPRPRRHARVFFTLLALSAGCFDSADLSKIVCNLDKYCPANYTCVIPPGNTAGRCEKLSGGGGDQATGVLDGAIAVDGAISVDQVATGNADSAGANLDTNLVAGVVLPDAPMDVPQLSPDSSDLTPADAQGDHLDTEAAGKAVGSPCQNGGECDSSFCVSGICCNTGTCSGCSTCATGTCRPLSPGIAPSPASSCTKDAANICGLTGNCDGSGACAFASAATQVQAQTCSGNTQTNAKTCNGSGSTVGGATLNCPKGCSDNACATTCQTAPVCLADGKTSQTCDGTQTICPVVCRNGQCVQKTTGENCGGDGDCASGHCANGVCCLSACATTCKACNVGGHVGTCFNIPAGTDPLGHCADQGPASCGTDGMCDGSGACRYYAAGTGCADASCSSGMYTPARTCSSPGSCPAAAQTSCLAYGCDGAACATSCSTVPCAAGYYCSASHTCVTKKPITAPCGSNAECTSAHCADGYCCGSACDDPCHSCNGSWTGAANGTCAPVLAKKDPKHACTSSCSGYSAAVKACDGLGYCAQIFDYFPAMMCNATGCDSAYGLCPCTPATADLDCSDNEGGKVSCQQVGSGPYLCRPSP